MALFAAAFALWALAMVTWDDPRRSPKDPRYKTACVVAGALLVGGACSLLLPDPATRRRVLANGVVVRGWVVQANNALFEGRARRGAPALLLISLPGDREASDERLAELVDRMYALKSAPPADALEASVAMLVTDETYRAGQRVLLPAEFTGGLDVECVHVWIEAALLPAGRLSLPFVRCAVIPGADPVFQVPYHPAELPRAGPLA